jgi:hypothetical protein
MILHVSILSKPILVKKKLPEGKGGKAKQVSAGMKKTRRSQCWHASAQKKGKIGLMIIVLDRKENMRDTMECNKGMYHADIGLEDGPSLNCPSVSKGFLPCTRGSQDSRPDLYGL